MIGQRSPHKTFQRVPEYAAALALLACGVLSIANLPRAELPLGWLVAWTAPATFFGCLRRRPHRPWLRAIAASASQIIAFALALQYAGSLSRPAILACTILPPLAFVIVRRRDADAALGLFLSFCVLLVGVILGGANLPLLAGYGVAACLSLRCETHLATRAASRGNRRGNVTPISARPVLVAGFVVAIPCLFAAFALDRTLAWIPSPLRAPDTSEQGPSSPRDMRLTGLDDSFNLGGGGMLADLAGEQLVLVRTNTGRPTPSGLYLRSGFFATPELHRWRTGPLKRSYPSQFDHSLRPRQRGIPVHELEIERFAGARNFIFVPPHATRLQAVPGLEIDRVRMWLRQRVSAEQTDYAVAYQDLPDPARNDFIDSRPAQLGLLTLPKGLNSERYLGLLDDWGAVGNNPLQVANRIAEGLAGRCRYDRIDPIGPYTSTIDNFLFATGDKRGYCMHFATAAALMLRLRGIPCRIGVGLYGGDRDTSEPEARIYGSHHAHAWVEIPFARAGWVVFDPTPPDERGQRMPTRLAPGDPEIDPGSASVNATDFWRGLLDFIVQPWFLLLVLVLAIATTMWPSSRTATPEVVLPRSIKTARRLLVRILRALATAGHLRMRGQTLEEFSGTLGARDRLSPAIADAFRSYQEVRFGGYPFDAAREGKLLRGLEGALATEPAIIDTP